MGKRGQVWEQKNSRLFPRRYTGSCRPVAAPAISAQMGAVSKSCHGRPKLPEWISAEAPFSLTSCVSRLFVSIVLLVLSLREDQIPAGKYQSDH